LWSKGYAEWGDETTRTAYLSIAFSWLCDHAAQRALSYRMLGWRVMVGGPGVFLLQKAKLRHELFDLAEYGAEYPDALSHHNPDATVASRGCPGMGTEEAPKPCSFCIVPPMEGTKFKLLPDFPVRPVLCDNNLSALPADYQNYIIRRYQEAGVKLRDANSGFEPITFTTEVYARWKPLINAGGGPWRFGYDTKKEAPQVRRVLKMLADEAAKRKRPYVLIGNEPYYDCMARIHECLEAGCEPHVQPEIKLNAREKRYWVRFDWTHQKLVNVARWVNGAHARMPFSEFDPKRKNVPEEHYDEQQGLFV
jgi:hypothetical protein